LCEFTEKKGTEKTTHGIDVRRGGDEIGIQVIEDVPIKKIGGKCWSLRGDRTGTTETDRDHRLENSFVYNEF
jgi:hypothetical protein